MKTGHFIRSQKVEAIIGIALFILGGVLMYDAFDARGKRLPWPIGGILPW